MAVHGGVPPSTGHVLDTHSSWRLQESDLISTILSDPYAGNAI